MDGPSASVFRDSVLLSGLSGLLNWGRSRGRIQGRRHSHSHSQRELELELELGLKLKLKPKLRPPQDPRAGYFASTLLLLCFYYASTMLVRC